MFLIQSLYREKEKIGKSLWTHIFSISEDLDEEVSSWYWVKNEKATKWNSGNKLTLEKDLKSFSFLRR